MARVVDIEERLPAVRVRCKNPYCKNPEVARGLCGSCNAAKSRLLREGLTTEEELVRKGKIDPKRRSAEDWLLAE